MAESGEKAVDNFGVSPSDPGNAQTDEGKADAYSCDGNDGNKAVKDQRCSRDASGYGATAPQKGIRPKRQGDPNAK